MNKDNYRILIVDDEESFALLLWRILRDSGYSNVRTVTNPVEAIKTAGEFMPNLVITDLKMPRMDGISLIGEIKARNNEADFIVITAFATVDTAVEAMKRGASDYITKPLKDPEELRKAVFNIFERKRLSEENNMLKTSITSDMPPISIIFAGMQHVLKDIEDVAKTNATVMLYGDTGTGKSLIAKVIHSLSGREGPFVDLNCAAIPENLLESELFGYERGAFTGANSSKRGRFELADNGTIFLDEVSEMSISLQAKFLRVLQDKTFERLGSLDSLKTNARIIAATNRELKRLVSEGRFREDLYYRLNVFPISIPPLRLRRDALLEIAEYLIRTVSAKMGKDALPLDEESRERILRHNWHGNVRELQNIIERAIIVSKGDRLTIPTLDGAELEDVVKSQGIKGVDGSLQDLERAAIENALAASGGNRKAAAERLGISLRTLQYKIKEYGLR